MADVAAVFHWSLASLRDMEVEELLGWHDLAKERAGLGFRT